jgi:hypothetical protein
LNQVVRERVHAFEHARVRSFFPGGIVMAADQPPRPQTNPGAGSKPGGAVGSDPDAASAVGGKGDFGAREGDRVNRQYASQTTKNQDPGAGANHAGTDGDRTSGVGGNESGVGSSSGGDLDTDVVGVGTGTGLSQSGPDERLDGPDITTGTSADFASGKPAEGRNQSSNRVQRVQGTTFSRDRDVSTGGDAQSSAAVTNPNAHSDDDSFVGEISDDEASGAIESQ